MFACWFIRHSIHVCNITWTYANSIFSCPQKAFILNCSLLLLISWLLDSSSFIHTVSNSYTNMLFHQAVSYLDIKVHTRFTLCSSLFTSRSSLTAPHSSLLTPRSSLLASGSSPLASGSSLLAPLSSLLARGYDAALRVSLIVSF